MHAMHSYLLLSSALCISALPEGPRDSSQNGVATRPTHVVRTEPTTATPGRVLIRSGDQERLLESFWGGDGVGGCSDLTNGDFADGLNDWDTSILPLGPNPGSVTVVGGVARLREGASFLTTLSQTFCVPPGATELRFRLLGAVFDLSATGGIPDAFEVALLDASFLPVVPTWDPAVSSFFNVQEDGTTYAAGGVQIDGQTITVDVTGVTPGVPVTLFFDLIGGDADRLGFVDLDDVVVRAPRPNDTCLGAAQVLIDCQAFDTREAGIDGPPMACGYGPAADLWFAYTAPADGLATIDTAVSDFDTRLEVLDACGGATLACSDDIAPPHNLASSVTLPVFAGVTYWVRVAGNGGATGRGLLSAATVPTGALGAVICTGEINSTGARAALVALGSASLALDDFTLSATGLPPFSNGYFINSRGCGFVPRPILSGVMSDGNLCIAGPSSPLGRHARPGELHLGTATSTSYALRVHVDDVPHPPFPAYSVQIQPGETWYFQFWYRDATPGRSNFSDAVRITFD